jgi:hypothetical protein
MYVYKINGRDRLFTILYTVFEDSTRFQARIQSVLYGLRRSLLGYYVDVTGSTSECERRLLNADC